LEQEVQINHTNDSLKVSIRGPAIMEVFHFRKGAGIDPSSTGRIKTMEKSSPALVQAEY